MIINIGRDNNYDDDQHQNDLLKNGSKRDMNWKINVILSTKVVV